LVEPHVLVATRVTGRRQLAGSVMGFERRKVPVRFMVTMMREGMRQHRGRVSGPEGDSQNGSK